MFYILDPQRMGMVEKHELKHFFRNIWHGQPYQNLYEAMAYLEEIDDNGTYNFREISALRTKYPNIFYPIYQFQMHVVAHSLGELWWNNHKATLIEEKEKMLQVEAAQLKKKQKEKEAALQSVSEDVLRRHMGIKYYLMPWTIAATRRRMVRIAAIESDLDKRLLGA